ncbi:galactokinase [Pseudalkalibacillus hwajinpoensis]|uniref:Galactokinase n=1 Tax=Guptibacillus hwajinpoensis TaxID=208199 RepID=A0A4U1MIQ3_9BACL|nr:galactokinase [Pseudalkalibacillus hwajinpoensis]TKD70913.1 galactokinase [Pseudalkalibacillus hwajinpoensis]
MKTMYEQFQKVFGDGGEIKSFFSPGRVNLIGEHTDYNGGHVFPCSLSIGTYAIVRKREDSLIRLYSMNFDAKGVIEVESDKLTYDAAHDWANYPKGVVSIFKQNGYSVSGFDVLYYGNIPNGAGLSSSASIELATSVLLNELNDLEIDMVEMVKMSQRAENEFVGVNCGIMDQFAIGMGKENAAVLLDCNTLEYSYSPVQLENASLVIANTNKRRGLADSKYNERRSECERALAQLQAHLDIQALGDLTIEAFETNQHHITNPVDRKRARHAVSENIRTIEAAKRLKAGDLEAFGQLMNESHISLRDDYEVTGIELDALVEAAWSEEGVIGSRMTGAGFGGCTISIVLNQFLESFRKNTAEVYKEKTGLTPEFYVVEIGDGAREINQLSEAL